MLMRTLIKAYFVKRSGWLGGQGPSLTAHLLPPPAPHLKTISCLTPQTSNLPPHTSNSTRLSPSSTTLLHPNHVPHTFLHHPLHTFLHHPPHTFLHRLPLTFLLQLPLTFHQHTPPQPNHLPHTSTHHLPLTFLRHTISHPAPSGDPAAAGHSPVHPTSRRLCQQRPEH